MAKKLILISLLLLVLAGLTGAIVYYAALPKNAPEQLAWARERENKNNVQIARLKSELNVGDCARCGLDRSAVGTVQRGDECG